MATPSKANKAPNEKLAQYEQELKRNRRRTIILSSIATIVFAFFIMMVSGDRFEGFLSIFGLHSFYNTEQGVYADCSKAENQKNAYCQRQHGKADRNWDSISKSGGSSAPFSLTGP